MTEHPPTSPHHPGGHPDPTAEEQLLRLLQQEHAAPLFGFVLHLVDGDRQRAEGVVQETLVRAWRDARHLDTTSGPLRPWLAAVARRIVVGDRRSGPARPRGQAPDAMPSEEELDQAARLLTISEALADLTEAHREIIAATYLRGRTANEAATVLGIPPATVRSRVFYALRSLKLALEERGVTS